MNILNIPEAMRLWSRNQRATHKRIGFVPTMGALHEGHASLIRRSVTDNDRTVVSIFVNPTQFAPNEDFEEYPRTWDADLALCEELGVDAIYHPQASTLYPEGYATYVDVENVSEGLCGSSRPHFFRGVATVVTKLFNAVEPDRAYFGQKDAQQAAEQGNRARPGLAARADPLEGVVRNSFPVPGLETVWRGTFAAACQGFEPDAGCRAVQSPASSCPAESGKTPCMPHSCARPADAVRFRHPVCGSDARPPAGCSAVHGRLRRMYQNDAGSPHAACRVQGQ